MLEYGGKFYVVGSGRQPLQKDKTGQHGGVALGKQGHRRDGDSVGDALIAEGHRLTVPEQGVSLFISAQMLTFALIAILIRRF